MAKASPEIRREEEVGRLRRLEEVEMEVAAPLIFPYPASLDAGVWRRRAQMGARAMTRRAFVLYLASILLVS
jgi:hypothetical protein